jgi:hypothetical protein
MMLRASPLQFGIGGTTLGVPCNGAWGMETTMQSFNLEFIPNYDVFPALDTIIHTGSLEMAYNYAAKLLQSESNTFFQTVYVRSTDEDNPVVRVCELVTTRRTQERME